MFSATFCLNMSNTYVESRNTLVVFISKKYKICFFGEHKAQEFGGGEGVRTVFSYGALASHTHRQQSTVILIQSFYTMDTFNQPTTPQSPKHLIHSMRILLKNPMQWNGVCTIDEMWWGIGGKSPKVNNINPVGFPPIPRLVSLPYPFYDVKSRLFWYLDKTKNKPKLSLEGKILKN